MKNLSTIFRDRIAYPDGFRFRWSMPSYGRRRDTCSFPQIPRMSAFRQVFGDAALLAACQSRRFTNNASDDALRAVLTASRCFRRFDRRTYERADDRETDRWIEHRFRARSNLEKDSFDDALTLSNAVGYLDDKCVYNCHYHLPISMNCACTQHLQVCGLVTRSKIISI